MKRVRINKGQVGLVYKRGELVKVLTQGVYYINSFIEEVVVQKTEGVVATHLPIDEMLENVAFKSMVDLIEVKDNEFCLVYLNGLFKEVLSKGRYLYFKNRCEYTFEVVDSTAEEAITNSKVLDLAEGALSTRVRKLDVDDNEDAILLVNGTFKQILRAGTYYFYRNAVRLAIKKVDKRMQVLEVSGQEMLTKDKASLRINFNLQYKVVDVLTSVLKNKDSEKQLYLVAQLLLREVVGSKQLDELLEDKQSITNYVMANITDKAKVLGIEVLNAGVKDIILSGEMKDIMNQVLVAQKKAQANVISRREEVASTRSMLNTAKLMEENQMLFKLKEMEYLEKIADRIGEINVAGGTDVLKQLRKLF
jgi:regulator of protease activity HflC (stomatin/prohibitin superfamily)